LTWRPGAPREEGLGRCVIVNQMLHNPDLRPGGCTGYGGQGRASPREVPAGEGPRADNGPRAKRWCRSRRGRLLLEATTRALHSRDGGA